MSSEMDCSELLEQLNELDEHQRIEAKACSSRELGESILETVCAYANEPDFDGGYLLLGVTRTRDTSKKFYEIVGVQDPDKLQSDLASQCASVFNRPVRPVCKVETINGKIVIGVFIPEAQPGDKPIYFKKNGLPRGAFRRISSTDQRCTEEDLQIFFNERDYRSFDSTILDESDLNDIDSEALADYRRSRREVNPDAEELRCDDSDLLKSLGCASIHDSKLKLNISGLVLFGKTSSLRRSLPMTRVDYIRVPGRDWIADPEHPFETIEMRSPLMRLISRSRAAILDDLPVAFSLPKGQFQRQEIPLIPERVLREALVNALMHRNYRISGPVQVIRYSNRIEIRNPGHSLKPLEKLGEPGSKTRNPIIAAVLHDTMYAETKGSGVKVMRELMKSANLTPPAFDSDREKDEFAVTFLFHHLLDESDVRWLAQFKDANITDDEAKLLVFSREKGTINNAEGRDLTGLDTLTVSSILRRLRDLGLIQPHNRGSATFYTPTERLMNPKGMALFKNSIQTELPTIKESKPTIKPAIKEPIPTINPSLNSLECEFPEIPTSLWKNIYDLGKHTQPEGIKSVIFDLCGIRPFSAEELAKILNRNKGWVRTSYLRPMIREGRIEYVNPDHPRQKGQAYRAVKNGKP